MTEVLLKRIKFKLFNKKYEILGDKRLKILFDLFYDFTSLSLVQTSRHQSSETFELNFLRDVLGLNVVVLIGNEYQSILLFPSIFLHPVLHGFF